MLFRTCRAAKCTPTQIKVLKNMTPSLRQRKHTDQRVHARKNLDGGTRGKAGFHAVIGPLKTKQLQKLHPNIVNEGTVLPRQTDHHEQMQTESKETE